MPDPVDLKGQKENRDLKYIFASGSNTRIYQSSQQGEPDTFLQKSGKTPWYLTSKSGSEGWLRITQVKRKCVTSQKMGVGTSEELKKLSQARASVHKVRISMDFSMTQQFYSWVKYPRATKICAKKCFLQECSYQLYSSQSSI